MAKHACFLASSGGHWEELMCLKEIAAEYDSFYVTEECGQVRDANLTRVYTVPQINRHEKHFAIHLAQLFVRAIRILGREKPDFIITTGALIAFPFCIVGKIRGAKVIYIESFARVDDRSLTGKLIYPFADLFLVQWESLLQLYPKAKYVGGIF